MDAKVELSISGLELERKNVRRPTFKRFKRVVGLEFDVKKMFIRRRRRD